MREQERRVFHGRRRGRPLRPGRRKLLGTLLPSLSIDLRSGRVDPGALFGASCRQFWLEIGFGAGEHLVAQAKANPDVGLIGCEPFLNGVARLLSEIESEQIGNVRIHADDARDLIDALPDDSIARAFILFPDPWPKLRHQRRRFVSTENLDALARVMTDGAELRLASDHADYIRWMMVHASLHPDFEWTARGPEDWRTRPADWPQTRYEAKAVARGERCTYLSFRRRPRTATS